MKSKGIGDSRMQELWRKAVRLKSGGKCVLQSQDCSGSLECDHFFGRRHKATRHDHRNGNLLCQYHHLKKHAFMIDLIKIVGDDFGVLQTLTISAFPDVCLKLGVTKTEFLVNQKQNLIEYIKSKEEEHANLEG